MSIIIKIVVVALILIAAIITEIFLDKIADSSWLIVIIKIVLAFVIIAAIGLSLKWVVDYFNLLK